MKALTARGERTRHRLLEAAERVFAEVGYHEASIVKITEAAGVGQGTFYLYFESKKAVFDEVVLDLNSRVRHAMTEAAGSGATRVEAELLGFGAFFRFTAEHPALYRIIRQAEFVSPEAMRMHYSSIVEGYIAVLEVLQERTLRVDRVLAAVVTERPAERPADLNLSQVWRGIVEEVEQRRSMTSATVLIDAERVPALSTQLGRHCQVDGEFEDGRVQVSCVGAGPGDDRSAPGRVGPPSRSWNRSRSAPSSPEWGRARPALRHRPGLSEVVPTDGAPEAAGNLTGALVAQPAEAAHLKWVQCGFESRRGHQGVLTRTCTEQVMCCCMDQTSSPVRRPRPDLVWPRCRLASSRRRCEPRVGLVARRGGDGGAAASRRSATRRRRDATRFCRWERCSEATITSWSPL